MGGAVKTRERKKVVEILEGNQLWVAKSRDLTKSKTPES